MSSFYATGATPGEIAIWRGGSRTPLGNRGSVRTRTELEEEPSPIQIYAALRWRLASYRQMPLATDTFKLSTVPNIGMRTS